MTEINIINKPRFESDPAYRAGVVDGINYDMACEEMAKADRDRRAAQRWQGLLKSKMTGWESPEWCCYFWHTGWDHISLGLHICLGGPNIEIHLPFGFIRVGRQTNVQARRDVAAMSPSEPADA